MPDINGLNIHDVKQGEQTIFDQLGRPVTYTTITYMVGVHGPYTDMYPKEGLTQQQVNSGYAQRIKFIRETTDPANIPNY